ncbi:MAG: NYN domain-containing protein [Clostridia bacterium]|nr:NYN domain-containing protein [Clostridia bacterium]
MEDMLMKVAIMVDGGFYRKRANYLFGDKNAKDRADELIKYCHRHLKDTSEKGNENSHYLYRIFYYDCKPSSKVVYHPLTQKSVNLGKSPQYKWSNDFFNELISKRKVALRLGELLDSSAGYRLNPDTLKKLCRKEITIDDLTEGDFSLEIQQKGVDMRIGLDIASLAQKRLVDKIILIAGDSDFVPAAKNARREGIDFVLDPMWHTIKDSLNEHVDGLESKVQRPPNNIHDKLHKNYKPKRQ